jgi:hemerythrin-like domain-containing protein
MKTALVEGGNVLRDFVGREHRDLARGITQITVAADSIEPATRTETGYRVHAVIEWFHRRFEEHLAWEDAWLTPKVDDLIGTPWGRQLRFEHHQIRRAFAELETEWAALARTPDLESMKRIRATLYGLAALIRAHVEREEWIVLLIIEELDGARLVAAPA